METGNSTLVFYVNGRVVTENHADPNINLLYYLRTNLRLTGPKLGCGQGGCGACTVMVSKYDRECAKIRHYCVNACLLPICALHGLAVTTVEGIGSIKTRLHPVQDRLVKANGTQCGFCSPGVVMAMYSMLRNQSCPSIDDLEQQIQGNLCRCTGYRPILDGFKTFTKEFCCGNPENCCAGDTKSSVCCEKSKYAAYDPTQEPIFPSELQTKSTLDDQSLCFHGDGLTWYRPVSLDELLSIKQSRTDTAIIAGNTALGFQMKSGEKICSHVICVSNVKELHQLKLTPDGAHVGGAVTLTELDGYLEICMRELPEYKAKTFKAIVDVLVQFSGKQIRNVVTVGGNIAAAIGLSDLNTLFMVANCRVTLISKENGERTVPLYEEFFLGHTRTVIKQNEVLKSVFVPFTQENEFICGYKSPRVLTGAFRVLLNPTDSTVKEVALSYSCPGQCPILSKHTSGKYINRKWDNILLEDIKKSQFIDGMGQSALAFSFFYKFFLLVSLQIKSENTQMVSEKLVSGAYPIDEQSRKSTQTYDERPIEQPELDPVGRPIKHLAAQQQTTGEAIYCDDIPHIDGELYMTLVTSTEAHANIVSVDASEALTKPGVVTFLSHKDVPGSNITGNAKDEEIFASEKVVYYGQLIGALIADTKIHAKAAAKFVSIKYEPLKPVLTMEEAIENKMFFKEPVVLFDGDVDAALASSEHVLEGHMRTESQEHFYLETHAVLVVPQGEDDAMKIFSPSQDITSDQGRVAAALGIPRHKIIIKVKRVGGGFGGKHVFPVVVPASIAAYKLGCPIRCMLDRDEDMTITGGRHPYLGYYKVGFDSAGKMKGLTWDLYCNGGHSLDLTGSINIKSLFKLDITYKFPFIRFTSRPCRTNLPSNGAVRGFGLPQMQILCESMLTDVATYLGIAPDIIRERNLYNIGDTAPHKQVVTGAKNIRRCWDTVIEQSNFYERKKNVGSFNETNSLKKRGISIVNTRFGLGFLDAPSLEQAGASIKVYTDGSVLLAHGGVEIGQGLHTKMTQVASSMLGIPMSSIHIHETRTDVVPNTTVTASSSGSDLNGRAVMDACEQLIARLEPFKKANPNGTWFDWVRSAYLGRISLSVTGFYRTEGYKGFDFEKQSGDVVKYDVYGTAVTEVEVDCLTGLHRIVRTDIVMDVGQSLNPAIDIGQIEGAFMMGVGMYTMEEKSFDDQGRPHGTGPGNYTLPRLKDVPGEFNVSLLRDSYNEHKTAVFSSKGVGEAALPLGSSVFFAIKSAVAASHTEANLKGSFLRACPATSEKIRLSCAEYSSVSV